MMMMMTTTNKVAPLALLLGVLLLCGLATTPAAARRAPGQDCGDMEQRARDSGLLGAPLEAKKCAKL